MKSYLILQTARVTLFTVSKLLRENQQGGGKITPTSRPRLDTVTQKQRTKKLVGKKKLVNRAINTKS